MINKFSSLYAGQIELENIGEEGTPADARRHPNERLVQAIHNATQLARLLDDLRFYSMWSYPIFKPSKRPILPHLSLSGPARQLWVMIRSYQLQYDQYRRGRDDSPSSQSSPAWGEEVAVA